MKYRILAMILALTVASWAQTSNSNPASQSATPDKQCACCDNAKAGDASSESSHSCCKHQSKSGKPMGASCSRKDGKCCSGDAKSCMQTEKKGRGCCVDCGKDKTAKSCEKNCGKTCGKGCCASKDQKAAGNCCQGAMQG